MIEAASKFLDLLKASPWQTGMISVAAFAYLYLIHIGVIPALDPPLFTTGAWAIALLAGCLCLASIGSVAQRGVDAGWQQLQTVLARNRFRRAFIDDIAFLSDKERQILGYLREKSMKSFEADQDGGYASTLIAKGYVKIIAAHGQIIAFDRVPMAVDDSVWTEVTERPDDFPYIPECDPDRNEVHPWRVPWWMD